MTTDTATTETTQQPAVDLWPIWGGLGSTRSIGYIVSTDDLPHLPYPRIGEVYRTPRGWGAWPMGAVFGDEAGPRSTLGFKTRRDAVAFLVASVQEAR